MADKLTKEALADQRKRLKIGLWRERAEKVEVWDAGSMLIPAEAFTPQIAIPAGVVRLCRCAYCGKPIMYPDRCVMHEWLIKRSDLPVEKQHLIMHEYNCVLVHYDCHERFGQWREFKLRCAEAQYKRYGRDAIKTWVAGLMLRQAVEIPTEEESCT